MAGRTAGMAAIGAASAVQGYGLAGAAVWVADTPEAVRQAWLALAPSIVVVILTATAVESLRDVGRPASRMIAILPAPPEVTP